MKSLCAENWLCAETWPILKYTSSTERMEIDEIRRRTTNSLPTEMKFKARAIVERGARDGSSSAFLRSSSLPDLHSLSNSCDHGEEGWETYLFGSADSVSPGFRSHHSSGQINNRRNRRNVSAERSRPIERTEVP